MKAFLYSPNGQLALGLILVAAVFVAFVIGGDAGDGAISAAIVLAFLLVVLLGRRRSDTLDVMSGIGDERAKLVVEILLHRGAELVAADSAGGHHLGGMLVVDESDQQMFKGRILVPALAGLPQGIVEGLFEFASETRHLGWYSRSRRETRGL